MNDFPIRTITQKDFPELLPHISNPPTTLYIRGTLPTRDTKYLCVVGSRAYTPYGKQVCSELIGGLRGYNISIVSGLALGIDTVAHKAALEAKLHTIAIPGSGLDESVLYPRANKNLASEILSQGGTLISEEYPEYRATPYSFPKRNRIMAGICHATLVIEAAIQSGTLITSKYATEYNRDVCAVPGSIFSKKSEGPHMLIRLGATPIRTSTDILEVLAIDTTVQHTQKEHALQKQLAFCTPIEKSILTEIQHMPRTRNTLIHILCETLHMPVAEISAVLMMLEIKELITEKDGEIYIS